MKNIKPVVLILNILIILIATATYFQGSSTLPTGYHVDHLANTLNAFCIRLTGADEYGISWPWYLRVFDDYRPPILAYIIALVGLFMPIDIHMARIIVLAMGFLGCALTFVFIKKSKYFDSLKIPVAGSLMFAFFLMSSWFLLPHRIAGEFSISIFFYLGLFVSTWLVIEKPSHIKFGLINGFFVASMLYTYYGTKLFYFTHFPIILYFIYKKHGGLYNFKFTECLKAYRGFLISTLLALFLAVPTFLDILGPKLTMQRYHVVKSQSGIALDLNTLKKQLDPRFLFFIGDANRRHHTGYKGQLNQFFLPFYLIGLFVMIREIKRKNLFMTYLGITFLVSNLPVSLTNEGIPHSMRTLFCLVPIIMIIYTGYSITEKWLFNKVDPYKLLRLGFITLFIFGAFEAYNNVKYYKTETTKFDQQLWTYFSDFKPSSHPSYDDHSVSSILDRYYLSVVSGDVGYCNGTIKK